MINLLLRARCAGLDAASDDALGMLTLDAGISIKSWPAFQQGRDRTLIARFHSRLFLWPLVNKAEAAIRDSA
jgi:hypothetical protein